MRLACGGNPFGYWKISAILRTWERVASEEVAAAAIPVAIPAATDAAGSGAAAARVDYGSPQMGLTFFPTFFFSFFFSFSSSPSPFQVCLPSSAATPAAALVAVVVVATAAGAAFNGSF